MTKTVSGVLLICALTAFSCVTHQASQKASPAIFGTRWQLVELDNESITAETNIKTPFILFSETDLKITGHTGCNSFFGSFSSKATPLDLGPLGMTRMACRNWTDKEIKFIHMLENATDHEIVQDMLLIRNDGKISARFKAVTP